MILKRLKAPHLLLLTAASLLLSTPKVNGQAIPSSERHIRAAGYGAFSYVRPAYQNAPRNLGVTLGGNVDTVRPLPLLDVGLDVRYVMSSGTVTNERAFLAGPRVSYTFGRFIPYGDYELGVGKGTFNQTQDPTYKSDTSSVRGYGGGFEYYVTPSWAFRGDLQQQRWRYTVKQPYWYPTIATIGVSYRVNLRGHSGPR